MDDPTTSPEATEAEGTAPPAVNAEGFALYGDYPLNERLRAEALSDAKADSDPDGIVSDHMIVAAGARLAIEREEAEEEQADDAPTVSPNMSLAKLKSIAQVEGVLVQDDDTRATIAANILAARAAHKES